MRRRSPAAAAFVTTDHAELHMEAHHKLDQPIELSHCGRIQVVVWNADRRPGTVRLELILVDNSTRGHPSESLGTQPVTPRSGSLPVHETLGFAVPGISILRRFDEFKVVFHRDLAKADRSVQIEIDRFILAPPGS